MRDLSNQKFNRLMALEPIKKNNRIYWKCQCDCGNIVEVRADGLLSGKTKSCGCYKKEILIKHNKIRQTLDLTNQRFGKLTAIKSTNLANEDGRIIWECVCDCGNICYVDTHSLQQGNVSSCGCLRSKGEEKIKKILEENNIKFKQQYKFSNCIFPDTKYPAIFDFYVENKYLIEYDGEQHFYYKNNPHTWNTKENYLKVKNHDDIKNTWCKNNNIVLIRIPYFNLDSLTINDLLIGSKYEI